MDGGNRKMNEYTDLIKERQKEIKTLIKEDTENYLTCNDMLHLQVKRLDLGPDDILWFKVLGDPSDDLGNKICKIIREWSKKNIPENDILITYDNIEIAVIQRRKEDV
jgi:hypothetical protein